MFEKVNPSHPDKVADRIAGAIVDLAYTKLNDPKIAVEILIGHGECFAIIESNVEIQQQEVEKIVERIVKKKLNCRLVCVEQDSKLAANQKEEFRCGDNGIFKGVPVTYEQTQLASVAQDIYEDFPTDGKYIIYTSKEKVIICQSNASNQELQKYCKNATINPLGYWSGGLDVDSGATNRKLGSDMGDAVTGGGLHGKDLSKADVSVNIWCHIQAQKTGNVVKACCAIGDKYVNGVPYREIVETAREYIKNIGGFEKFAEWGLIR